MSTSTASASSGFTYKDYTSPAGKPIKQFYATSFEDSERIACIFEGETELGLDCEWAWKDDTSKTIADMENEDEQPIAGENGSANSSKCGPTANQSLERGIKMRKMKCSVLQLASSSIVAIFHFAQHSGTSIDTIIPPTLRRILENEAILKLGRSISVDGFKLRNNWSIHCKGLVDLGGEDGVQALINDPQNKPKSKSLLSLAEHYLGKTLVNKDGSIHDTEDWSEPLTEEMMVYAYNDAFVGLQIFRAMNAVRLSMNPIPELPIFAIKEKNIVAPKKYSDDMSNAQKLAARKDERISSLSPLEARIYSALESLRDQLAAEEGITEPDKFYRIADRKVLLRLSEEKTRPTTMEEFNAMTGMGKYAKQNKEEWVAVIRKELFAAGELFWWNDGNGSLKHVLFFVTE
jgi:hypothetical protein